MTARRVRRETLSNPCATIYVLKNPPCMGWWFQLASAPLVMWLKISKGFLLNGMFYKIRTSLTVFSVKHQLNKLVMLVGSKILSGVRVNL